MIPKKFDSPLDDVFDVDNIEFEDNFDSAIVEGGGAPPVTSTAVATTEPSQAPSKDEEDTEIDRKIDEVYTEAIAAYQLQTSYLEVIEPRYAARNAEVAANFLNIALAAANSRARVKTDRKRSNAFVPFNNQANTGTVVATHDEIMKMIAVDADHKEVK